MKIGSVDLARQRLLIAEIGNNHEGDPAMALDMVAAAAKAGAGAVKVQLIDPERLVNCAEKDRVAQLTRFRLSLDVFRQMADLAHHEGILFIASAFDVDSLARIAPLCDGLKIASGDLDFLPLIEKAAQLGKPLIVSTGMGTLEEVASAVKTVADHLPKPLSLKETLALLHCVSLYPTPLPLVNLKAIQTLEKQFGVTVGYSDHTLGIEACVASMSFGARVLEKHFTLDKTRTTFRDHALSADPADLRRLAEVVTHFDAMAGQGEKVPAADELPMKKIARRATVAARDLQAGRTLEPGDLDYVRPQKDHLSPAASGALIGRSLRVAKRRHEPILEGDLN